MKWVVSLAEAVEERRPGPDLGPAPNEIPEGEEGDAFASDSPTILFAGGCFWCLQRSLDGADGVTETYVGYSGGAVRDPTYGKVQTRKSGHVECVVCRLDPRDPERAAVNAIEAYIDSIDPTEDFGQDVNRGPQYRCAIFYTTAFQRQAAREALDRESSRRGNRKLAVRVRKACEVFEAEEVHQHYYKKNGLDPTVETPYWMGAFLE